jgi:NAD(P)-dependent dehydrogenase (short-subunit alcohol dehydrogenase family)
MGIDASRFSLEGKVALIVGGSGDLGHAIVNRFVQAGATVLLTSRKIDNLQKVADEVNGKGGKAAVFTSHLGKSEEVKKMVEQVKAQYKTIDILVNSAGANPQMVTLDDLEEWAWDTVMNVNLKGTWLVSKEVVADERTEKGWQHHQYDFLSGLHHHRIAGCLLYQQSRGSLSDQMYGQ